MPHTGDAGVRRVVETTWQSLSLVTVVATLGALLVALCITNVSTFHNALPILSNGAFLLPACAAWSLGRYTRMCIFVLIIVASSMYHSCYAFGHTCHLDPLHYQHLDFFFAQLVIPLTALYVVRFDDRWAWLQRVAIVAFAFVIVMVQLTVGHSLIVQMVIAAVSLVVILGYWMGYNVVRGHTWSTWELIPNIYHWDSLGQAVCLTGIACALFVTQMQAHTLYWAVHSVWHVSAALAQYHLLYIHKEPDNPGARGYSLMDRPLLFWHVKRHTTPKSRV